MRACHVRCQHPALSCSLSRGSLERQSTRSLAEALGRTNRLTVGAGQTPTRTLPSPLLHTYTRLLLASLSYLFRSRFFIISERISFFFRTYLFLLFLSERVSPQNASPHRTPLFRSFLISMGCRPPQAHPPHWGTVTMTTRALSKKAGVGARERMLLRKN